MAAGSTAYVYPATSASSTQGQKPFTTENTEGTEFILLTAPIGAVNNKKGFSVPSVFSVVNRFLSFSLQYQAVAELQLHFPFAEMF